MTGRKKIFTGLTVLAALLLVFFLSLNYLASAFINLEFVKKAIWTSFSRQTGGTIEYQSIDLSLFPSAHAVIRKINISLPGRGGGTAEKLDLYPEILPLFRGKLLLCPAPVITTTAQPLFNSSMDSGVLPGLASVEPMCKDHF